MRINFPSIFAASRTIAITSVEIVLKYARRSAFIPTGPADFYIQPAGSTKLASTARFEMYAVTKTESGSETGMQIDFDVAAFARDYDAGEILSISVSAYRFLVARPASGNAFHFNVNLKELEFDRYDYALSMYNPLDCKFKSNEYWLHGEKWKKLAGEMLVAVKGLSAGDLLNYREAKRITDTSLAGLPGRSWSNEEKIERIKALRGHMVPIEANPSWDDGAAGAWEAISIASDGGLHLLRVENQSWHFAEGMDQFDLKARLFAELGKSGRDTMAEYVSREIRLDSTMYLSQVPVGQTFKMLSAMFEAPIRRVEDKYYKDIVDASKRNMALSNPLVRVVAVITG